jgi:hypothetical protein
MPKKPNLSDPVQREAYWTEVAKKQLLGKTITGVRYLSRIEAKRLGWDSRPVMFQLNDGNVFFAAQDDEGNGPGALFTNDEKNPTLPIL